PETLRFRRVHHSNGPIDNAAVELLDHQPAAGLQRGHEPFQRLLPLRHVLQNEPRVDEIERLRRQRVGTDVMAAGRDAGVSLSSLDETWVDVGDEDRSGWPDAVRHPGRDRTAAAANLQAVPTWSDAGRLQEAEGAEVVERVEAREALRGLSLRSVVEDVGRHWLVLPGAERRALAPRHAPCPRSLTLSGFSGH